nr:hybrid sensor histidine kinase/response regulator [Gammaproteobacteria bacterium]
MFKDIGLKGRVLLLGLLPTTLMALGLGSYFIAVQLQELEGQLMQRGQSLAEHLAPLAAPALARHDAAQLERIAKHTLEQADVRSVSFLDDEYTRLANAGPKMLSPQPNSDGVNLALSSNSEATRFLLPVFEHHRHLANTAAPEDGGDLLLGWVELELSHHGTLLRGYRTLLTSLLLVFTGLVITALLAIRLSRSISEPLQQIKHSVALLKEGRLETRLPPLGSQEMDELAAGINRMAESLQNAQEELQHSIEQATEDVRQNLETIEIQNIELDFARREALEASRIKSEFLANMSHEIRTPLNGILGFTRLLQKSELTPRQQDYLNTIEKSADGLLGIINEVLDFSKIEAGKLVLESIPFNLRDLIQEAITLQAPAAHSKQLELVSLIYRDTPLSLIGDPQRLKQILTNLISNAIKFTHSGTIAVRTMLEDETDDRAQLRISVQDTGIGLAEDELRNLFQAFSQADNSLTRQTGGTGLGLVISKRLVEQMGGEIGVTSTPGEGSEFWISLSLPKAREVGEALPRSALQGHRAALLEPHELARQTLQHQLEDLGLQVQHFSNLDALLEAVSGQHHAESPLDLAVLGVRAQDLPPERLCQHIWELERLGCHCLVLCPTTEQALYQQLLPEANSQVLAKPACPNKVQQALLQLFGQSPQRSEPAPLPASRAPRLLCVDDNPANLLLIKTLLEDMGAEVSAVDNGHSALEAIKQNAFDLVFMDVQMPGMDGRQTTEAIRQWESSHGQAALPIIALTAHALANEKRALLQTGMDDYLTKPITERQLAQVVLKWTGLALRSQAAERPQEPAPLSLGILDPEEGLRLAAGKADLAADLLNMLLSSLPGDREAIHQARASGDRTTLIERIHRLHGATRYCGVPQLRAACQRCETLLKQNDPAAEQALDDLDAAIERLAAEAKVSA